MDLKGKVALVTGAARGIGRAIACKLAAAGAHVVVADRGADADPALSYPLATPAALAETARLVESEGVRALPLNADVTSAVEVRGMVERAAAQLGGIDILVNNAGVVAAGPLASITEEVWDRVMDVNVKGVFLCTQAVIPLMAERGEGRIVNIASVAGKTGRAGVGVYCASKFAVIGLTQALAEEVGPFNITVNAICPGYLRTAMWTDVLNKFLAAQSGTDDREVFDRFVRHSTYLRREQTPEDIGDAVVFLCRAPNITGIALNVAGGGEVH